MRLFVYLKCRIQLLISKWPFFFFLWKLELRSLVTFFLQANIYSQVGKWQEGGFKMKMLPSWSLHLSATHGVTMDKVLRTQNICQFVEFEETKLFSFVKVNSKNHILYVHHHGGHFHFLYAWFDSGHAISAICLCYFFSSFSIWGRTVSGLIPHVHFHFHTFTYAVFSAWHFLRLQLSSRSNTLLKLRSGSMSHMNSS